VTDIRQSTRFPYVLHSNDMLNDREVFRIQQNIGRDMTD